MIYIKIEEKNENERIDKFLTDHFSDKSRSELQDLIKEEYVLVNNKPTKNNYRLKIDDEVSVEFVEEDLEIKPVNLNLDIVYEDEYLLVVNKPKDLIVHPSPTSLNTPTLVHGLLYHTDELSDVNGEFRPGIVHRLDKDTSGLLMVAKTNEVHEALSLQLQKRSVLRSYLALVHHPFNHGSAIIDAPIGRDPNNRQKMAVTHVNSRNAKTKVFLEERFSDYSLLRCELETGRTHQIRVHLQYIEHPIVGDKTYSYKNTMNTNGQCLHAHKLGFVHPITHDLMHFEVEPPEVFMETLNLIRREDDGA